MRSADLWRNMPADDGSIQPRSPMSPMPPSKPKPAGSGGGRVVLMAPIMCTSTTAVADSAGVRHAEKDLLVQRRCDWDGDKFPRQPVGAVAAAAAGAAGDMREPGSSHSTSTWRQTQVHAGNGLLRTHTTDDPPPHTPPPAVAVMVSGGGFGNSGVLNARQLIHGSRVRVEGLLSQPECNGLEGTVKKVLPDDRVWLIMVSAWAWLSLQRLDAVLVLAVCTWLTV